MPTRKISFLAVALTAGLMGACANDGSLIGSSLTTSSVDATQQAKAAPVQPKFDPVCIQLATQIDNLRKDGVAQRISQASEGKSASVQVKRASLAKMTELDKANAEFQAKCSNSPAPTTATAPVTTPPAATASEAPAKPAAKKTSSAKPADTTVKAAAVTPQAAAPAATPAAAPAASGPVAKQAAAAPATPAAPAAPVVASPATPTASAQATTTAKAASASTIPAVPSVPGISIAQ